uniref:Uncharacterized protein n=1 Tax=Cacopsylla melanoneura TaxID=428564 RepID=A0A8D9BHX2_9HEMI
MSIYIIIIFLILILLLTHEVLSNLHVIGNDVLHHHHRHTETQHKHYRYPVPVYYHSGPKPHLHPYPYHLDGEPHPAHIHRRVRPIPINDKRKRRRIPSRRKHHGKRRHPVLEIPVIHHHHPPEVYTEPPIYRSALHNLLANPVPSEPGVHFADHGRRGSHSVAATPLLRRGPVQRPQATILRRTAPADVHRAPNLKSAIYDAAVNDPVLLRPPVSTSLSRVDQPLESPQRQSSFLRNNQFRKRSNLFNGGSFDRFPILDDNSPVVYETPTMPEGHSYIDDGPSSSSVEDNPFRKSSIRRDEHYMNSHTWDEPLFMEEKPSRHSFIMDDKPHDMPTFMDDEGPHAYGSSKIKDKIYMDSSNEKEVFLSDFKKKHSFSGDGDFMESPHEEEIFLSDFKKKNSMFHNSHSSEDYIPFREYKEPLRKSSIRDDDIMESMVGDKPPTDEEIFMDDHGPFKSSSLRDGPFLDASDEIVKSPSFRKSSIMRDRELMEALVDDDEKPVRMETSMDDIHFMEDEDVPYKRSVTRDKKSLIKKEPEVKSHESIKHKINGQQTSLSKDRETFHKVPHKFSKHESSLERPELLKETPSETHLFVPKYSKRKRGKRLKFDYHDLPSIFDREEKSGNKTFHKTVDLHSHLINDNDEYPLKVAGKQILSLEENNSPLTLSSDDTSHPSHNKSEVSKKTNLTHLPFIHDREPISKPFYKVVVHIPKAKKDEPVFSKVLLSEKSRKTRLKKLKRTKLSQMHQGSLLKIPLIANVPDPNRINGISVSSVSDRKIPLKIKPHTEDDNSKKKENPQGVLGRGTQRRK